MASDPSTPIHSPLTCDSFSPHVGSVFSVLRQEGESAELELVSATPYNLQPFDGRTLGRSGFVRRDPFSLLFRSAQEVMLPQSLYDIDHPEMGRLTMLLVPVGPGESGWLYEAVFN